MYGSNKQTNNINSKYFTVRVKPTLLAAKQHLGAYADGDVIFDWTEFKLSNGAHRLIGCTAVVRGNDGAAQDCPMDLMFATQTQGHGGVAAGAAPQSIGTQQAASIPTANPYYNDLIGGMKLQAADYGEQVQTSIAYAEGVRGAECPILFESYGNTVPSDGNYTFYVTATANSAAPNFDSNTAVANVYGAASASIITLDGTSALTTLAPGDVVRAQDEAIMGTVSTVDSATQITLTAANTAAIADGDVVYRLSPITLIFTFERY